VQDGKNQRIEELLHTTDDLLKHLATRIANMKTAAARASDDPELDDEFAELGADSGTAGAGAEGEGVEGVEGAEGAEAGAKGSSKGQSSKKGGSRRVNGKAGNRDQPGGEDRDYVEGEEEPEDEDEDEGEDDDEEDEGVPTAERFSGIRQYGKLAHSAVAEEILTQPKALIGPNGTAVQLDPSLTPVSPRLVSPLELKCDKLLSNFAVNFNLRPYSTARAPCGPTRSRGCSG